jgi:short-subunit dehydrogenase
MARLRPPPPHSILITGASSGIGAALARRYARPGTHLALGARHPGRLATIAAECRQTGADVREQSVDVTDRATMAAWIAQVDRAAPLDLVIANAGTAGRHLPHGPERTRTILAVNLDGVLNTIEPAEAAMLARGRGHLALMSSFLSFYGSPNSPAYCSSKAAVRLLGESLRARLAQSGIVVSVICPGIRRDPDERGRPSSRADHDQRRPGRGDHRARSGARPGADRLSTRHLLRHARARHSAPGPGRQAHGARPGDKT